MLFVPVQATNTLNDKIIHAAIQKQHAFTQSIQRIKIIGIPDPNALIFNSTITEWILGVSDEESSPIQSIDRGNNNSLFIYFYDFHKKICRKYNP